MALGWGIVGIGGIANNAIAPAIGKLDDARLVTVVSRDQGRADEFAARHGAARGTTSYDELLADPDVDVVYIGTPNALHAEQAIAAARAGKHVFCDKPLATSVEEAERVLEACREAGAKLGINFQTRHHEGFAEARRLLADGAIGDVLVAQLEVSAGAAPLKGWRTDPELAGLGSINNIGVHAYDLLRYLLGAEVAEVVTLTDVSTSDDLETTSLALFRFGNGTLAYVNANQTTPNFQPDIDLYGTKGRIVGVGITRPFREGGELRVLTEDGETVTPSQTKDAFDRSVAAFHAAVRDDTEPNASGLDGLRSVQLTDAMARSARERRVIELSY